MAENVGKPCGGWQGGEFFHSISTPFKDHSAYEASEVAESDRPGLIALDAVVLYFQSAIHTLAIVAKRDWPCAICGELSLWSNSCRELPPPNAKDV
jgi:hypothetical protein